MKAREFNSVMPLMHERWAANVLNMKVNPNDGPDLISDSEKPPSKLLGIIN